MNNFRAYNKDTKEMVYDIHIAPEYGFLVLADNDAMSERERSDKWVLMPASGLKAKTKMIYSGDILDIGGEIGYVEFMEEIGAFIIDFWKDGMKSSNGEILSEAIRETSYKILGNIYQNPKLLKS